MAPPYTNVSPARTLSSVAPLTDLSVMIIDPYEASRSVLRDAVSQLGSREIQGMRGYVDAMKALRKPGATIKLLEQLALQRSQTVFTATPRRCGSSKRLGAE